MGYTVEEVLNWSIWEFKAICDGWDAANGPADPPPEPPSDDEFWDAVHGDGPWKRNIFDGKDKKPGTPKSKAPRATVGA